MDQEVKPGRLLTIPCRLCGSSLMPLKVEWGRQILNCRLCHKGTQIDVREEDGIVRIRTHPYAS